MSWVDSQCDFHTFHSIVRFDLLGERERKQRKFFLFFSFALFVFLLASFPPTLPSPSTRPCATPNPIQHPCALPQSLQFVPVY